MKQLLHTFYINYSIVFQINLLNWYSFKAHVGFKNYVTLWMIQPQDNEILDKFKNVNQYRMPVSIVYICIN